jgi:hypothetical protein
LGLGLLSPSLDGGLPLLELLQASWASQLLHPLFQLHQTFLQGQDDIHQHFGMAAGHGQQFFTREQLHGHKTFRKSACRG